MPLRNPGILGGSPTSMFGRYVLFRENTRRSRAIPGPYRVRYLRAACSNRHRFFETPRRVCGFCRVVLQRRRKEAFRNPLKPSFHFGTSAFEIGNSADTVIRSLFSVFFFWTHGRLAVEVKHGSPFFFVVGLCSRPHLSLRWHSDAEAIQSTSRLHPMTSLSLSSSLSRSPIPNRTSRRRAPGTSGH
jgi:hypothetical protein